MAVTALATANSLANPNFIRAGQILVIVPLSQTSAPVTTPAVAAITTSAMRAYTVRAGDTLTAIAARIGVTPAALAATNNLVNMNRLQVGQSFFCHPSLRLSLCPP